MPRRAAAAAVVARSGFGHQTPFAHASGQQRLPQRVVDLVRSGVKQIFPFQPQVEAQLMRKRGAEGEGGFPSCEVAEQIVQFLLKGR